RAVEGGVAERDPLLGSVAGEIVLGQVGPVDRWLLADQRHRTGVALAAQDLGRRGAGRARAEDDDRGGGDRRLARRRTLVLFSHPHGVTAPFDFIAGDRVERRTS